MVNGRWWTSNEQISAEYGLRDARIPSDANHSLEVCLKPLIEIYGTHSFA